MSRNPARSKGGVDVVIEVHKGEVTGVDYVGETQTRVHVVDYNSLKIDPIEAYFVLQSLKEIQGKNPKMEAVLKRVQDIVIDQESQEMREDPTNNLTDDYDDEFDEDAGPVYGDDDDDWMDGDDEDEFHDEEYDDDEDEYDDEFDEDVDEEDCDEQEAA